MRTIGLAVLVLAFLLLACPAQGGSVTLTPNPSDLYDLDHYKYYTWGISTEEDISDIVITDATLFFDNIRNYNNSANDLWVHLLDSAPDGVRVRYDGQGGGDNFAGQGVLLEHYEDLPSTPQDITYQFTESEIDTFNDYFQNGSDFALGFDPDCHYYNDGVYLTMEYDKQPPVIPEPLTMTLSFMSFSGLGAWVYRRRKKDKLMSAMPGM